MGGRGIKIIIKKYVLSVGFRVIQISGSWYYWLQLLAGGWHSSWQIVSSHFFLEGY